MKGSRFACWELSSNAFLELLLDFDKRVNDNKTAAEEALKRIPAINRTIAEANEKTREAQLALGNAAADATEAKNKAHEAERIASAVQKVCASSSQSFPRLFPVSLQTSRSFSSTPVNS
jgi:coxsackievirus/adenovirus receptor